MWAFANTPTRYLERRPQYNQGNNNQKIAHLSDLVIIGWGDLTGIIPKITLFNCSLWLAKGMISEEAPSKLYKHMCNKY